MVDFNYSAYPEDLQPEDLSQEYLDDIREEYFENLQEVPTDPSSLDLFSEDVSSLYD